MSQDALQGKQQALIRVAESRVAVLDSVSASYEHAARCVRALPVSPAVLKKAGVAAGAAASVMGIFAAWRRKKRTAEKTAVKSGVAGVLVPMLLQSVMPMILPLLQNALSKHSADAAGDKGNSLRF